MSQPAATGYSGKPLAQKLGIRAGARLLANDAPVHYLALLGPLPGDVTWARRAGPEVDLVHLFAVSCTALRRRLTTLRQVLRTDTVVWVSWPKKSARVSTDITEDRIREIAFPLDYVDVKVCAVDEVWSGLKLVVRRAVR